MEHPVDARAARRVIRIGQIVLIWAICIFGRLLYLQVFRHDELTRTARAQQQHIIPIPTDRGDILDRTGHPLAISLRTESVAVNPQRIRNPEFFAGLVAPILQMDSTELASRIRDLQDRKGRGRGFLLIKRNISPEERKRLAGLPFNLLEFLRDSEREYPNGTTAAHVVGSLDSEGKGNSGLEQKLNEDLQGRPGAMRVLTDSTLDPYLSWVSDPGRQGTNLTLSIHNVIQHDAERFLQEGVAEASAEHGTVVVMDPSNGEILAMANYPSFDPRESVPSDPAKRKSAMDARRNTAVQAPCEPGSVMKMITISMALESGKFRPETPIFCENGSWARPGRRPIHDIHRMGTIDIAHVLIKSSNIGVAKISNTLGPQMLWTYLNKFGMGQRTNIELPGETRGILRPLNCKGPGDRWCWTSSSHEYIAFGHEIEATAVQLARAVSVVANGGMLVQPHLVIRRDRPRQDGTMEEMPIEVPQPTRSLKPETAFTMRRIMQDVVLEGTGRRAKIPGYSSAGKTGSAEIFEHGQWQNKHNSSFIGFAPVNNPRVVVVVTLNRTPKQGGIAAAPVFGKVALTALRVLQVPKDEPDTDIAPDKQFQEIVKALPQPEEIREKEKAAEQTKKDAEKTEVNESPYLVGPRVPDFRGKPVVAVLRQSAELGLPVEIMGQGRASGQKPAPGEILPVGHKVQVEFSRP